MGFVSAVMQKQKQKKHQQRSEAIRWSDSVTAYQYDTECGQPREEIIAIQGIEKPAYFKHTRRPIFRCEADAINSQLRKKLDQLTSHLERILPELAKLQWSHLSFLEIEVVENEIIDELDRLQHIDTRIGDSELSSKYELTEKNFNLLLEAQEVLFKLSCADTQLKKALSIKSRNRLFRLFFVSCASFDVDEEAEYW